MTTKAIIPTGPEFMREALIVIGGALLAAFVLSNLPAVRAYIQRNISGGGVPPAGCDCNTH